MDRRVFDAAQNGDMYGIQILHSENPELLREDTYQKNNVLHITARKGHSGLVEWILENVQGSRSMCSARNSDNNTVLHEAAKVGDAHLVSRLITFLKAAKGYKAKLLLNVLDKLPALVYLVPSLLNELRKWPQQPLRGYLVGCELNVLDACIQDVNRFGETPLLIACKRGHEDVARHLLEVSTPIDLLFPKYQPCLHVAAYGGHKGIVNLLLNKSNGSNIWRKLLFLSDAQGANPLHTSIYGGHIEVVKQILNATSDSRKNLKNLMTEEDGWGRRAIHVAVVKGRFDIVDLFMSSIPDCTESRSSDGKTVLHFAVAYDRLQFVQKLFREQNEVVKLLSYDQDNFGNTALHMAAQKKVDAQLLRELLSFPGLNLNAVNNEGLTPLDIADADAASSDIKRIFEEKGASANYTAQPKRNKVITSLSQERESKEDEGNGMDTLVASLVATVTFAAIFQVPGGIEDDKKSLQYGVARLAFQPSFKVFLISDTVALFTSLIVVIGWICRELQKRAGENKSLLALLSTLSLGVSVVSTAIAFISAVYLVTIPPNLKSLKTKNKEAFQKYMSLYGLVYYGSITIVAAGTTFLVCYMYWRLVEMRRGRRPLPLRETLVILIIATIAEIFMVALLFEGLVVTGESVGEYLFN